ncbi:hypothetical protein [Aeromonas veronii]|uniref:hypothetical protein n=1 Tax=Aeromonas veronii TaxID=654 RepID=UPI003BA25BDE
MAKITFRAKVNDGYVKIPKLGRQHCDMNAFHYHPRYRAYSNSTLFPQLLARIASDLTKGTGHLNVAKLPANVEVDTSKFLATVTIEV